MRHVSIVGAWNGGSTTNQVARVKRWPIRSEGREEGNEEGEEKRWRGAVLSCFDGVARVESAKGAIPERATSIS